MRIKDHRNFAYWVFFIKGEPEDIRVPTEGYASNILDLEAMVRAQFANLPDVDWNEKLKEEAHMNGIREDEILREIIQHQICLRNPGIQCWNSGIGDKIHEIAGKIDRVAEKTPLRNLYKTAVKAVTKQISEKPSTTLGGCGSCGGSRSYNPNARNNLGRAGKVNRFLGKKPSDQIPMG